jgi:hypothetical protein
MNENELEPWLIVLGDDQHGTLAMWRVSETEQPALALFSSAELAEGYANAHHSGAWHVTQPQRTALLRLMIECYQQQVTLAVLDPTQGTARSIFNLRDVLRAARQELA